MVNIDLRGTFALPEVFDWYAGHGPLHAAKACLRSWTPASTCAGAEWKMYRVAIELGAAFGGRPLAFGSGPC
jgi:hypothetical protein